MSDLLSVLMQITKCWLSWFRLWMLLVLSRDRLQDCTCNLLNINRCNSKHSNSNSNSPYNNSNSHRMVKLNCSSLNYSKCQCRCLCQACMLTLLQDSNIQGNSKCRWECSSHR